MAPGTSRVSVELQKPEGNPSPPFIATAPALESLALLDRGLGAREPFVVVTGEPGVGKSTLVREALRRWGARVHARSITPAEATAETLFATLLSRFGGTANSQASASALAERLLEAIAHAASAGKVVMVVVFFASGCLEIVSILFRPVSLSFRLYGNVFAGENMLETMATLVPGFGWLLPIPFYFLELLVGLVQAMVFMLLTAVFTLLMSGEER